MSDQTSWASNVGAEEGVEQLGGPAIVASSGELQAFNSAPGDELVACRCDLDEMRPTGKVLQRRPAPPQRALRGDRQANGDGAVPSDTRS